MVSRVVSNDSIQKRPAVLGPENETPMRSIPRLIHGFQCVLVFFMVTVAGLTSLPQPFDGDQALFSMGAQQWVTGEIYFRDFWDLKPPGIYLFYVAAGQLFGFDEVGIHLFELLWSLTCATALAIFTRHWYKSGIAKAVVPLITVGVYYCIADTWHLTQIEWLVTLPLVISLWCMCPFNAGRMPSTAAFFFAGICGGLIGLCKPMYGLIPVAIWFWAILLNPADGFRNRLWLAISRGVFFATGVFIPLAAAGWYFHSFGVLDVALRTMFEYPARVLAQKKNDYEMLAQGLTWCALMAGPMMAFALIGSILAVRSGRCAFSVSLVTWLIVGLLLVFAQGMWWEYHYLLLLTPLALLALKAIETIILQLEKLQPRFKSPSHRMLVAVCIAVAFSAYPATLVYRTARLRLFGFAIQSEDRLAYQSMRHLEYRKAIEETRFLHAAGSRCGDIYVFGNPVIYRFAGRHQAVPQQGWAIKVYLPEQWSAMKRQLASAKPVFIFVAANRKEQLLEHSADIVELLNDDYQVISETPNGTWHELGRMATESITVSDGNKKGQTGVRGFILPTCLNP